MLQAISNNRKPYCPSKGVWFFFFSALLLSTLISACSKDETVRHTTLFIKTGASYTPDGAHISLGGSIKIGIQASGAGAKLTYYHIEKIVGTDTINLLDKGIFIGNEGLDVDFNSPKDTSAVETWRIVVMNSDRYVVSKSLKFYKGSGTAYNPIYSYDSIKLSFQNSDIYGHYLDVHTGNVYTNANVAGHESEVDLLVYYYVTSGLPSPTFICPGYVSVVGYYPNLDTWPVRNNILYDYYSSDNNLVSIHQFDAAKNDSLLVSAYKPDHTSGNSKYGYTGKVVPFKTQEGKYGLIKVIHADQIDNGMMEIAVKIQQ